MIGPIIGGLVGVLIAHLIIGCYKAIKEKKENERISKELNTMSTLEIRKVVHEHMPNR